MGTSALMKSVPDLQDPESWETLGGHFFPLDRKKSANEAGEMVRQLRAFTLPAEDLWVQFLALTRWLQVILTFSSRAWHPFLASVGTRPAHGVHTYMQAKHTVFLSGNFKKGNILELPHLILYFFKNFYENHTVYTELLIEDKSQENIHWQTLSKAGVSQGEQECSGTSNLLVFGPG